MDLQRAADLLAREDVEIVLSELTNGQVNCAVQDSCPRDGYVRQHHGLNFHKNGKRDSTRGHR